MKREVVLVPSPRSRQIALRPRQYAVSTKHQSVWNSLSDKERKLYASILAGLGVVTAGTLIFLLVRSRLRAARARVEESKAFGNSKHATWAKQFKQAFDNDGWWGTDVPLVRRTMTAIPSKEDFKKVQESYKALTSGGNLIMDLSDELTKLEYDEMLTIKNAKPEKAKGAEAVKIYDPKGWARRLNAAVSYTWIGFMPGTDEDAIKTVFREFPNKKAFYDTAAAYKKMYGTSLSADLDGDLDWSMNWRAMIKKK